MSERPLEFHGPERPGFRQLRSRAERHGVLLAYLIPTLLSAIVVQTWFEPGTTIATGDLAPPVAPGAEYMSHWSHLTGGEGGPTFDLVGIPYAGWLDLWNSVGVGEDVAQRLWLTLLFAGSTAAVVFLAIGFTGHPLAAGVAGLLATFNPYRMISGPDAIPMTAILVAALLAGLVVRAALRRERPSVVAFAVVSLALGYVMTNPPHVVLVVIWVAVCALIAVLMRPGAWTPVAGYLARATPLAFLVNLWWIVPAFLTVTEEGFDERFTAATVDDWTWTHERATLLNALTLNTHWAWNFPEYFPYADELARSPFDFFVLALPALAATGVVLGWNSGSRRLVIGFGAVAFIAAWLATGLNGPVPAINRWLYDNLPGYWLFREPSKLLLLVALPAAILAGIGLSRLLAAGTTTRQRAFGLGLAGAALLYVHPLLTGEVVPDDRPLLPSAHVRVPEGWKRVDAALEEQSARGKVLVLPRADYYQLPTTWGYYGAPFTASLISRPVLELRPGGYFDPPTVVASLVESIESDLARGRIEGVGSKFATLGIRYVLLRRDIDPNFPDRRILSAKALARGLALTAGVKRIASLGVVDLYAIGPAPRQEVFAATPALYAGTDDAIAHAVGTVPGTPGFVAGRGDQRTLSEAGVRPTQVVRIEHEVARRVNVKRQGRTLRIRLVDPFRLTVGDRRLRASSGQGIAVPGSGSAPFAVTAGDSVLQVRKATRKWASLGLVGLEASEPINVWRRSSTRAVDPSTGGPVRDCNVVDDRTPREAGIRGVVVGPARTLRLSARAHAACKGLPLVSGRSRGVYGVRFSYRQLAGRPPRACVWVAGAGRCAPVPDLKPGRTWKTFRAAIVAPRGSTGIELFLYADGAGSGARTVAEYRRIRLESYVNVGSLRANPRVQVLPAGPKTRTLAFAPAPLPPQIDLADVGPVGDCHRLDERSAEQVGLESRIVRESDARLLRLTARDHSACVSFAIAPIQRGARAYRIRFEYRGVSGRPPRVCLWQEGPDRCASLPPLRARRAWQAVDDTIKLDSDVRALRLFLYADGGGGRPTIAEYRDIHVGPVGSVAVVGIPKPRPLPKIAVRREASWKFHVRVEGAKAPFLLATSEAYADGWKASVEKHDDSQLRHVEVNGYANGWLVPFAGSYDMTLEYGPERYARAARLLSILSLVGVLGFVGLRRLRAFDVGRHAR